PHLSPEDPEVVRLAIDQVRGPENIFRKLIMPYLRESHADTLRAVEGVKLLLSHPITLCSPLVAEERKLPWASAVLAPLSFFSIHEPTEVPGHPIISSMTRGPMWLRKFVHAMGRRQTLGWC